MRALRVVLNVLLWPGAALLALLCAVAAVAAQWGRVDLQMDVLAHFAPFWLLGGAAVLASSLLFRGWRRWILIGPALVAVIAAASMIVPEFVRYTGPKAPPDAPDQLKIVQFNVWHENPDPAPVIDWLNAERPDIALIEENSPVFYRELMRRGSGWYISCRRCEVMVLSRRPPVRTVVARKPHAGPAAPLTEAVFADRHGEFHVIGVHNAWPTDADQPIQERRLAGYIADRDHERLIVTGDFNSAPWSFQRRRWEGTYGLVRRERAIPSWPARSYKRLKWLGLPFLPIDHVYAGPGWATVSVRRGPRLTSDHYPLVLTLAPVARR